MRYLPQRDGGSVVCDLRKGDRYVHVGLDPERISEQLVLLEVESVSVDGRLLMNRLAQTPEGTTCVVDVVGLPYDRALILIEQGIWQVLL